jgi:hypothetical protein
MPAHAAQGARKPIGQGRTIGCGHLRDLIEQGIMADGLKRNGRIAHARKGGGGGGTVKGLGAQRLAQTHQPFAQGTPLGTHGCTVDAGAKPRPIFPREGHGERPKPQGAQARIVAIAHWAKTDHCTQDKPNNGQIDRQR